MGIQPTLTGHRLLEETFRAGPSTGILPWRIVCLDPTVASTPNYGTQWLPPCKHPSTTFTAGESVAGVAVDPASENPVGTLVAIVQNRAVNVRTQGTVPILTDDTTGATNILVGDYVRSSTSTTTTTAVPNSTCIGCAAKAARTANVINTAQHIIGLAYTRVNVNSRYVLVGLEKGEY
jgi:hypothetical protein